LSILCGLNLQAQGGGDAVVKGIVTDAVTGEPLLGTNIAIEGTSLGASSGLNGEYTIPNIPAGTHTVLFKYIGYKSEQTSVELSPGETFKLDMGLAAETIMGEEIIITTQARGQLAAINQQRSSNQIINVVASDRIREVPDVNAAESIGRLPGVSLQRSGGEGERVVIRGLSPKFSIIEMDGVRMPGASEDRSVSLSTVSSEMLDGIELSKSLTADKDADAIGGIVNLRTRVADEGFHFNVYGTGAYNNLHNSFGNYRLTGSAGNRWFDNKIGVLVSGGLERVDRSADEFSADYAKIPTEEEDLLQTLRADIQEVNRIRERAHGSLVLDYRTDFMSLKFNNIYSQRKDNVEGRTSIYLFDQNNYNYDIRDEFPEESFQMHSLLSEFNIWKTILDVDYSYSRSKSNRDRDLYHFEDIESLGPKPIDPNKIIFAQPANLIRDYYDEVLTPEKAVVRWNEKEKEIREDVTNTLNVNWKIPYRFGGVSGSLKTGFRYKKKVRSSDQTTSWTYFHGGIGDGRMDMIYQNIYPDLIHPIDVGSTNGAGLSAVNFVDPDYDYGNFLDGRYNFPWAADLDYLQEVFDSIYRYVDGHPTLNLKDFHQLRGPQSYRDDYEITEQLMAGYIMAEIHIGRLLLLPGVRFENIQTEYTSNFVQENYWDNFGLEAGYPIPVTANRENSHWFPSLNLKYDVTQWMDIRGAYYKSASRPDFALLSPSLVRDMNLENMRSYNPYLKPALAHNYDLGVSFFTNKLGLFTINGFYKTIDDLVYRIPDYKPSYLEQLKESGAPESLIESLEAPVSLYDSALYSPNTNDNDKPVNNPNKSSYYGFELSWQSNFWYLPGLLSGLVLDLNYSMLWSQTELPYVAFEESIDSSGFFPIIVYKAVYDARESRMLDQPAQIFNARIGWDYKGFSSRLSFRYQASTITRIDPIHSLLDEVNKSLFRMDLNLKQNITRRLAVSLDIANLNNYIDDREVNALGRIFPKRSEYYGMNIILGLRYDF
jgi:TonB-dependent receptor